MMEEDDGTVEIGKGLLALLLIVGLVVGVLAGHYGWKHVEVRERNITIEKVISSQCPTVNCPSIPPCPKCELKCPDKITTYPDFSQLPNSNFN